MPLDAAIDAQQRTIHTLLVILIIEISSDPGLYFSTQEDFHPLPLFVQGEPRRIDDFFESLSHGPSIFLRRQPVRKSDTKMLKDLLKLDDTHSLLIARHLGPSIFKANLMIFRPLHLFHRSNLFHRLVLFTRLLRGWACRDIETIFQLYSLNLIRLLRFNNMMRDESWIKGEPRLNVFGIEFDHDINRRRMKGRVLPIHIERIICNQ